MGDPTCPHCGGALPEQLLRAAGAAAMGRKAKGAAKARTSEQARKAALASVEARRKRAREAEM